MINMETPKILVGAPISDMHAYCFDEFINAITSLSYPNYNILLIENSKTDTFYEKIKNKAPIHKITYQKRARERVTQAHNYLREKVINEDYDYLFILDQDVIPPKDVLERLTSHNKKVCFKLIKI